MLELALHYEKGPVFLRDIARAEEISEKYLGQIIIPLKSSGLVNSSRGARGGYMLARPPAAVTVRDIVDSLEGGISVVECVQNPSVCSRVGLCATRTVWASLEEKISETLSSVTLEDLISKCRLNEREYIYSI
jgi:Rrf2 family protein